MSALSEEKCFAPLPVPTRGKPYHFGGDPKNGQKWIYWSGSVVYIRDLENSLDVRTYREHSANVTCARISPSGFWVASADQNGNIRVWGNNKDAVLKLETKPVAGPISDIQWSDDSKRIVVVGEGRESFGAVFMWDAGSTVGTIQGSSKPLLSADIRQVRPYRLATGSEDSVVSWFEGPPFKLKNTQKDHAPKFVNVVRFSPDGERLLSGGQDKIGILYDGKTGEKTGVTLKGHTLGINCASWSGDSNTILTASGDKTCRLWDKEGNCKATFKVADKPEVDDMQMGCLIQKDFYVSVSLNGHINYWDPSNPDKPKKVLHGHTRFVTSVRYDSSNDTIYSGDAGGVVVQWSRKTGETQKFTGKAPTSIISNIGLNGNSVVVTSLDDTLRSYDTNAHTIGEPLKLGGAPHGMAFRDGVAFCACTDSVVVVKDGKIAANQKVAGSPQSIAVSAAGDILAVGCKDNVIRLFKVSGTSLTEDAQLTGSKAAVSALAFSPDGKYLASGDAIRHILIWEVASKKATINDWISHASRINGLAWSPNSQRLASVSLDTYLYVWDLNDTAKRTSVKDAHHGGSNAVQWIDDNTIVTGGQDFAVRTWTLA